MIFAGDKAGNPWHGTWTEDGLELPNAETMTLPVAVAGGDDGWPAFSPIADLDLLIAGPRHGDCLLVRIPGLPVPATSEAEEALGMEWLNYTLISGANRLLYGVPMGPARWVYIDDNDEAWLVWFQNLYPSGSAAYPTFWFHRLVFGGGGDKVIEASDEGPFVLAHNPIILDAAETGRSIVWGYHTYSETDGHRITWHYRRYLFSGVPGVDLEISGENAGGSEETLTPSNLWINDPEADLPSGSCSASWALAPYWIFDGDDAVELRFAVAYDAPACDFDENTLLYADRTISGNLSVVTTFGSFDVAFESTRSNPSVGLFSTSFSCDGWSFSHDNISQNEAYLVPFVYVVRQTNKSIEVVLSAEAISDGEENTEVRSVCRILPDRFEATGVTTTLDQIPVYMTYHPVTTELLESSAPVCFM